MGLGWVGSLGLVEYRAPYGANNGCSTKSESFRFYAIDFVTRLALRQSLVLESRYNSANS